MLVGSERGVDLRMEERHLREVTGRHREKPGQVFTDPTRGVADGRDVPDRLAAMIVDQDASGRRVRRDTHACGPLDAPRARVGGARIVIPGGVDHRDPVIPETLGLLEEEALGLERESITVEEIPRDEQGVHVLTDRGVDGVSECLAGGLPESGPHVGGASGESGVEVYVGDVQEAHGPS